MAIVWWKNSPGDNVLDSSARAASELWEHHLWGTTWGAGANLGINKSIVSIWEFYFSIEIL